MGPDDQVLDLGVHRFAVLGEVAQIQFADRAQLLGPRNVRDGEEIVTRPEWRNDADRTDAGQGDVQFVELCQGRPGMTVVIEQGLSDVTTGQHAGQAQEHRLGAGQIRQPLRVLRGEVLQCR